MREREKRERERQTTRASCRKSQKQQLNINLINFRSQNFLPRLFVSHPISLYLWLSLPLPLTSPPPWFPSLFAAPHFACDSHRATEHISFRLQLWLTPTTHSPAQRPRRTVQHLRPPPPLPSVSQLASGQKTLSSSWGTATAAHCLLSNSLWLFKTTSHKQTHTLADTHTHALTRTHTHII